MSNTQSDDIFRELGAHGVVRMGNGIQVVVGLHVPLIREQIEALIQQDSQTSQVSMTEAV